MSAVASGMPPIVGLVPGVGVELEECGNCRGVNDYARVSCIGKFVSFTTVGIVVRCQLNGKQTIGR